MSARRVVCAGGAVADLKFHLAAAAVPGTSNPASVTMSQGGMARNVVENLARLLPAEAWQVGMMTALGDDDAGRLLLEHLRGTGVDDRHVHRVPGFLSARYAAVLEPGGDLNIGIAVMDVLEEIQPGWLDDAWPDGGWLFCDTNLPAPVLAHALARASASDTPLAVGAVSSPKVVRLPARLDGVTLLSCNVDEARAWLDFHDLGAGGPDHDLAQRLHQAGAQAVLLTRGAAGVIAVDPSGVHPVAAVPAEVVDVTGAGDALIAGALAVLMTGGSLVEAAQAGAARAARTVESHLSVLP